MNSTQTQYASRQAQSTYQVQLPHHRQPSSSSSGSYPSPSDTTSQHSPGPNYAYHRNNPSLNNAADVKREYDDQPPASNRYYAHSGYGYSNSGYNGPPSSTPYYQQNSQGGHYPSSTQFGSGSNPNYSSIRPRCSDSPPVSPVTSPQDYFINPSSSSSASSPTSPASPVNGYHYSWQSTHTHQSDCSSGHYTPTDLPPQYHPHGSAHDPFQPPPRSVSQITQALAQSTTAPRPFVCEECGMNFSRQHDLKRHYLSHSTPPVKKTHPCPYCGKHLSRRDAIKRHVVSKQCPTAAEKNYGWPVPENFVHAPPIPPTTTRTRGSSTSEDARIRRESITNPYPRVDPIIRDTERAEMGRLDRTGNEARIVVDPRSGGYPVAYAAGRP